jgi:hypothetical protein
MNTTTAFSAIEQLTLAQFKTACGSDTLTMIQGEGTHNWFRCGTTTGFIASKFDTKGEIILSLLPGRDAGTTIWCLHNAGTPKNILGTL